MPESRGAAEADDVLLDHRSADGPVVVRVRGTLLAASLRVVKDANLFERYLSELPKAYQEPILYSVATSWLPVELMMAHYATLDCLDVPDVVIERNAAQVGERLGQTFMANVIRLGRSTGMQTNSWTLLKQTDRVWDRVYAGGGCRVLRIGPKDAQIEFRGLPMAQCRYYRVAQIANLRGLVGLLSKVAYVRPVRPRIADPLTLAVTISWV